MVLQCMSFEPALCAVFESSLTVNIASPQNSRDSRKFYILSQCSWNKQYCHIKSTSNANCKFDQQKYKLRRSEVLEAIITLSLNFSSLSLFSSLHTTIPAYVNRKLIENLNLLMEFIQTLSFSYAYMLTCLYWLLYNVYL